MRNEEEFAATDIIIPIERIELFYSPLEQLKRGREWKKRNSPKSDTQQEFFDTPLAIHEGLP